MSILGRLERIPFTRKHLGIAAILGTGTFFDAFDLLAIGIALTVINTLFHLTLVQIGVLISGAYAGQFCGGIVFGLAAERYGRKWSFIAALGLFGICAIAAGLVTDASQLLVARVVQGFGLGAEVPIAGTMFNEFVRGRSRGKLVIAYESLFLVGLFVAPLAGLVLFRALSPDLGWRALFFIGGIPVVVALLAIRYLPESPRWLVQHGRIEEAERVVSAFEADARRSGAVLEEPQPLEASTQPTHWAELFAPFYLRRTLLSYVQWFTIYFALYGYSVWVPTLYVKVGKLTPTASLALTSLICLLQLIAVIVMSSTIDRVGRKPWFIFGYAIAAAGMLFGAIAVGVFHDTSWQMLLIAGTLLGIGAYVSGTAVYLYTPELFPTRMRAWATSTSSSVCRLASTIAPFTVGALLSSSLGIGGVYLMFAADLILGLAIFWIFAIETKGATLEELSP
jgi:MFS transporter, putative metabolite:H+ symporter